MNNKEEFIKYFNKLIKSFNIKLSKEQLACIVIHYEMLIRWNKVHNLTTITSPEKAALYHYLDCLLALRLLPTPPACVDIGSGGGFPGIVAAILWPQCEITLVERNEKKQAFLKSVASKINRQVNVVKEITLASGNNLFLSRATFSFDKIDKIIKQLPQGGKLVLWISEKEKNRWKESCDEIAAVISAEKKYKLLDKSLRYLFFIEL